MDVNIQFPALQTDRERITMFQTPPPAWSADRLERAAQQLGVRGKFVEAGQFLLARDRRSVLEIFQASDSLRWGLQNYNMEGTGRPASLPSDSRAAELAERFIGDNGLGDDRAALFSVTHTEVSRVEAEQRTLINVQTTAVHVNYRYKLDGLPVFVPGAKMQVSLGDRSRAVEAYRFWREPMQGESLPLISSEEAATLLQRDGMFADLRNGQARVTIESVQLGYYALPPMHVQRY